ncbi:hypothetical protein DyAD56_11100 [Dyella sp. AD56]|uniref:HdeD family acid-resistance protein n=2 Tax=unclassified Dyella TaxID=2634549 RepID=UPI000C85B8B2|nr:DUF308 domain-containing protein [Dyella sp. AD56]PMQ05118.1 hypothetical protein DyAD56_11100 [Dyella sp. AD56]
MQTSAQQSMKGSGWILMFYGIISVLFGISLMMYPISSAVGLAWAIGIVSIAEGLVSVIALFRRHVTISKGWLLLYAVVSLLFGVAAVSQPAEMAGILFIMLTAWLIIAGIVRVIFALCARGEIKGDWVIGLSGVLAIVLGVLLFMYPGAGIFTVTIWIGALALVYGVTQIIGGFRLNKLAKV